jgi:hypothetical protein
VQIGKRRAVELAHLVQGFVALNTMRAKPAEQALKNLLAPVMLIIGDLRRSLALNYKFTGRTSPPPSEKLKDFRFNRQLARRFVGFELIPSGRHYSECAGDKIERLPLKQIHFAAS